MTWLLVSTSPDEVMIIPVPAAEPVPFEVAMTVLMSTIAGSTLAAMAGALNVPFWLVEGEAGAIGASELEGATVGRVADWVVCDVCRYRAMVRPMPIPPPAARMVATTVTTATHRPMPWCWGGAGGV